MLSKDVIRLILFKTIADYRKIFQAIELILALKKNIKSLDIFARIFYISSVRMILFSFNSALWLTFIVY